MLGESVATGFVSAPAPNAPAAPAVAWAHAAKFEQPLPSVRFSLSLEVNEIEPAVIDPPPSVKAFSVLFMFAVENTPAPAPPSEPVRPSASDCACECDVAVKLTAKPFAVMFAPRPR